MRLHNPRGGHDGDRFEKLDGENGWWRARAKGKGNAACTEGYRSRKQNGPQEDEDHRTERRRHRRRSHGAGQLADGASIAGNKIYRVMSELMQGQRKLGDQQERDGKETQSLPPARGTIRLPRSPYRGGPPFRETLRQRKHA